ncbi:hypothetical protein DD238_006146 [Peronospora effusa]|uniref:Uncharacterized protein n=1 Tax=Peronospora effusa TaxID=542832 RepID=A0A3M6VE49_9STRA|nr:hypothetical protein DD238_006146 [Peronospora effusa]RQM13527.1 hypothetical protein DD237_006575 [Peronospora effusa]
MRLPSDCVHEEVERRCRGLQTGNSRASFHEGGGAGSYSNEKLRRYSRDLTSHMSEFAPYSRKKSAYQKQLSLTSTGTTSNLRAFLDTI